jgi:hypothetical protein
VKKLSSYITGAATISLGLLTVLQYNDLTGLRAKVADGRFDVENVRMYTAPTGYVYHEEIKTNSRIVKTKYVNAYDCQSGARLSACVSQSGVNVK